jgi:hypothetical protein
MNVIGDGINILKILTIVLITWTFNSHHKNKPRHFRNYPKEQVLKLDSLKTKYTDGFYTTAFQRQ